MGRRADRRPGTEARAVNDLKDARRLPASPSGVRGPVDFPQCKRQRSLFIAIAPQGRPRAAVGRS